ncbi:MAG: substrate-binding domain-containing protein [Pseudonocardia sp.]
MMRGPVRLAVLWVAVAVLAACTAAPREAVTLQVLASSELVDMAPLLADLRAETGVELVLDLQGTVDAANVLTPGEDRYDLAWLSSDRYLQLELRRSGYSGPNPLRTTTMLSSVAVGVTRATAQRLRADGGSVSWADLADRTAAGELRFAMGDPRHTGDGLAALVGVATAAAGTGRALRPEDVTCDRVRGFLTGQQLTADTSPRLIDDFVAHRGELDALVTYESVLLSLNDSGRLAEPLEIIYPTDGIVQSDYPLLLLDPTKRAAYDRVVEWLRSAPVQQRIMEQTSRRPIDPEVPRTPRLHVAAGNALYFPDEPEVIDRLLANYAAVAAQPSGHVIFLLDFSGSMRGRRAAALRQAFADLTGTGDPTFVRFHRGERFTVIRFGGRVLEEREFTVGTSADPAALRDLVATESDDSHTAVWSTVSHAYDLAATITAADGHPPLSVVLITDGISNTGLTADDFLRRHPAGDPAVPLFAIHLGDADAAELTRVATATGGRMVDADRESLPTALKEIRDCS